MKDQLTKVWTWARNKYGRIITAAGFLLSGTETFDITPIKDPLEGLFGAHGHAVVSGLTIGCFGLSFIRHQQIAHRVTKLQEAVAPMPVPSKDVPEK